MIKRVEQFVIYENPLPQTHSRHGYFPGLAQLPDGELICLFTISEAFESPDMTTWIARSSDEGHTWRLQGRLYDKRVVGFETSDCLKPTVLHDGSLIAVGYRFHRRDPELPIAIPATGGLLPGDDLVSFSTDQGRRWSLPDVIPRRYPELLEISGPCIQLRSGDLLAVGALSKTPEGTNPSGHFGVLLRSSDGGRTWDDSVRYFDLPGQQVDPFEARLCEMQDGRVVAIVWAYDAAHELHLPNHVVVSHDEGRTWGRPIDSGLMGQAANLLWLGGDRLLAIQAHRGAAPGIFVREVDFSYDEWTTLSEELIYGAGAPQTRDGQSLREMFSSLRFGQPSLVKLQTGDILACHWCVEDGQGKIRAHRLQLESSPVVVAMPRVTDLSFDPMRYERGGKHRELFTVDAEVSFPLLVASGAHPGPTLVVSANVHGDEYEGVRAIFEVFDELDPALMSGDLLAVPVLNGPAFWSATRCSPIDGANLARIFPGDPSGTYSQRLAWHFGQSILSRAQFYLDLHSGGVQFRMPSMAGYSSVDPRGRAAAEIFGAAVIWGHPTVAPGRTVSLSNDLGIPWIYTEARGAGRIHPEDLAMMKRGIRNLMRHLGILHDAFEITPIKKRLLGDGNTDCGLSAGSAGFFMNDVTILDRVEAGRRLGRLVDLSGVTIEEYLAPADGIIGLIREFPVVRPGDVLYLLTGEEQA